MMRGLTRLVGSVEGTLRRLVKLNAVAFRIAREEPLAAVGAGLDGIDVAVMMRGEVVMQRRDIRRREGHMIQPRDRVLGRQRQHLNELLR